MTALQSQIVLMSLGLLVLPAAQAQSGSISGTLLDPDGKPTTATVVLRRLDAGAMREQATAADGTFVFNAVAPGTYSVAVDQDDFIAGAWINVGPSQFQPNPNQTVILQGVARQAGADASNVAALILIALSFAALLFWLQERINLSYLRVPIVCWALWAALPLVLFSEQHALLALQQEDARWVGIGFVFAGVAIWQSRAVLVNGFLADHSGYPRPSHSSRWVFALYVAPHVLLLLIVALIFALNAIRSGTPERQQFVSGGFLIGAAALFAILLAVAWLKQGIGARTWLKWPSWPEFTGKVQLFATLLAGLVTYSVLFRNRIAALESGTALDLGSPIVHLLFLLGELCLLLSVLCLWLDRYRVPLLSVLVLMIGLGIVLHRGDYVFASLPAPSVPRPTPAQAVAGRNRIIVVAAEGGGVQAAAWTARVLGGLAEENSSFAPAVRLLSGVSGGSVGVLYFMNTYPSRAGGNGWTGEQAFRAAAQPLLDVAAWGLVGRDMLRMLGGSPRYDRGWAIDRVLGARSRVGHAPLSQWSQNVPAGLPAVLLNATEVETGRPLAFSTTALKNSNIVDFGGAYNLDLEIATAARLSASFPYVTPVARPEAGGQLLPHIADGGYYDNYGLFSLMDWLDQVLAETSPAPEILVLRIEAFPLSSTKADRQGWPFQLWAPMSAMMSVRTAAQSQRNEAQLALFQKHYKQLGTNIGTVLFRYQPPSTCPIPPLSWDLSPVEIECLSRAWQSGTMRPAVDIVNSFLNRKAGN